MKETINIPQNIKDNISQTGYEIVDIHPHGKVYILKLKRVVNMLWDAKDFDMFPWVVENGGINRVNDTLTEFKLKIKF